MMGSLFYLSCLFITFPAIYGQIPEFIKICKLKSPDFKACAVKNGNAAIPSLLKGVKEFDIPSFTPLKLPLVEFSSGDLQLNGTDFLITGFPNFTLTDLVFEPENRLLGLNFTNPKLELNFYININGKIGSLRLVGNGPTQAILYDAACAYRLFFNTKERKGKTYLTFEKDDFMIAPTKAFIHIENLFSGSKLLGDNVNQFLNENALEVITELRPVISEVVASIIRRMLLNLFRKVPLQDLFLDY